MAVLHASSILLVVDLGGMLYKHLIRSIVTSRSIALEHTLEYSDPLVRGVVS
jgi:sRNA-binding regulator protein Hfq